MFGVGAGDAFVTAEEPTSATGGIFTALCVPTVWGRLPCQGSSGQRGRLGSGRRDHKESLYSRRCESQMQAGELPV